MKKIAQQINSDKNFTNEAYRYMKQEFDRERAKPFRERDFDKIERLSSEICELLDGGTEQSAEDGMARLFDKIAETENIKRKSPARKIRKFIPAIIMAAVLAAMNCISVLAWDMNIISAVIEFSKGGFSVDFGEQQEEIVLPTSEDDPYGFIAKLAEYDIEFETPHYLPEGFVLTDVNMNVNEDIENSVRFIFHNGKQSLSLSFTKYHNEIPKVGIPSDHYNISETKVNGSPAIVSREDDQYTITYLKDKTEFFMFSVNVPYEECEKIVESIK